MTGKGPLFARLAMAGAIAHGLIFTLLHLLEPELGLSTSLISDYARTGHGFLAGAAYLAFAAIWLALAVALGSITLVPRASVSVGRLLFVIAAVTIMLAAFDPVATDPRHRESLGAMRAIMSRFARPGLFVGIVLVSLGLRRLAGWDDIGPILVGISATSLVVFAATIAILLPIDRGGLGQRALFLLVYAWVLLVGGRMLSLSGHPRTP